jgi:hypothetical protein
MHVTVKKLERRLRSWPRRKPTAPDCTRGCRRHPATPSRVNRLDVLKPVVSCHVGWTRSQRSSRRREWARSTQACGRNRASSVSSNRPCTSMLVVSDPEHAVHDLPIRPHGFCAEERSDLDGQIPFLSLPKILVGRNRISPVFWGISRNSIPSHPCLRDRNSISFTSPPQRRLAVVRIGSVLW